MEVCRVKNSARIAAAAKDFTGGSMFFKRPWEAETGMKPAII
jgi:hypothetical protein